MKLEVSDIPSNHSDFSNDSQSSQESQGSYASAYDYVMTVPTSRPSRSLLTLANLEGLQSGVPTRTTATITPTQLRNLEQTYIELTNCRSEQTNHAGFVPPSVTHANHYGILNPSYVESGPTMALQVSPGPFSASGDSSSSPGLPAPKRRTGGRRPTKAPSDISPEEEERRKVRRERNKMAAARCRKRRLDHTNELQEETDMLEEKKRLLQDEIRELNADKTHLETILRNHTLTCRLNKRSASPPDVKPFQEPYVYPEPINEGVRIKEEVIDPNVDIVLGLAENNIFTTPHANRRMLTAANPVVSSAAASAAGPAPLDTPPAVARPNRPNFLQIHNNKTNNSKIAGIEITTPSNGIPFNFDSLMEGGTGLTPVQPHPLAPGLLPAHSAHSGYPAHPAHPAHCAQQQRSAPDLASPDTPNSLVSL